MCTALGQIAESLNDDIGAGLQPRGLRRYDITQLTHGVSYMNQVNANARITALDVPLRNLTSTINDLQNQYQLTPCPPRKSRISTRRPPSKTH
ncbi:Uncharacterised protein [Mycobacteroides abscessus subsp. massiliense]|nr:Uncharacterised protein [Mycobacteroides abscessus subsp. massiliense]